MLTAIRNPIATLIAIPILALMVILQSAIFSWIPLLHGTADLVLLALLAWAVQERVTTAWQWSLMAVLFVSIASALSPWAIALGYLASTGFILALRRWIWKTPFLAMMAATFFCTLLTQSIDALGLRLSGIIIPWQDAFNLVILPSALLNLLVAIPVYALIGDLARWVYPQEIKI